jgi:branched-chain amino acid transport system ATP-binding protein
MTRAREEHMHKARFIIQDEHRSLAAVLHGLLHVADDIASHGSRPDFRLLDAMIAYIEGFPEACHHPKEDAFLFRLLRERAPQAAATLDDLEAQHREGQGRLAQLKQALADYRACIEARAAQTGAHSANDRRWDDINCQVQAAAFLESARSYADFQWKHMRIEEDAVLRLAEKVFTAADWTELEAAFTSHRDPLRGIGADGTDFRALFTRVVTLTPAPIGLGPAREAA